MTIVGQAVTVTGYFYIYGEVRLVSTIEERTVVVVGCNQYYLQMMFWPVVTTHYQSGCSIFCQPSVVFALRYQQPD